MRYIKANPGKIYFVIGTLLIGSMIFVLFKVYGYENTWKLWQVPTLMPPFADLRLIPGGAETFRRGLDPTIRNPGDPYGRIFNYPKIWYLFFYTSIDQEDVIWLGIVIFALFYIGLISFPGKLDGLGVLLMILVTFSPATMLLYERGNVDLLIFFICAMAILALNYSSLGAALIILVGALLKIFPLFGLSIFFGKGRKQFWRYTLLVVASFGVYAWLTFSNIRASWNLTMRGKSISYGVNVLFDRYHEVFSELLKRLLPAFGVNGLLDVLPYLLGLMLLVVAVVAGLRNSLKSNFEGSRNLTAFRMGAFIYLGTFLMGNNWDYRLAFLLFTLPQLAEWVQTLKGKQRLLVAAAIGLVILSSWHFVLARWCSLAFSDSETVIIFDEIANWSMFFMLAYLAIVSLPDWAKEIIRNPVRGIRLTGQPGDAGS